MFTSVVRKSVKIKSSKDNYWIGGNLLKSTKKKKHISLIVKKKNRNWTGFNFVYMCENHFYGGLKLIERERERELFKVKYKEIKIEQKKR